MRLISHLSLGVRDLALSKRFYDALLLPLDAVCVWQSPTGVGYGRPGEPDQLALFPQSTDEVLAAGPGFHLAFHAPTQERVVAAYRAALAVGGADEGPPGPRPAYGPRYFAAFLRDPDGHKIELKQHV